MIDELRFDYLEITPLGNQMIDWFMDLQVDSGQIMIATLVDLLTSIRDNKLTSIYEIFWIRTAVDLELITMVD